MGTFLDNYNKQKKERNKQLGRTEKQYASTGYKDNNFITGERVADRLPTNTRQYFVNRQIFDNVVGEDLEQNITDASLQKFIEAKNQLEVSADFLKANTKKPVWDPREARDRGEEYETEYAKKIEDWKEKQKRNAVTNKLAAEERKKKKAQKRIEANASKMQLTPTELGHLQTQAENYNRMQKIKNNNFNNAYEREDVSKWLEGTTGKNAVQIEKERDELIRNRDAGNSLDSIFKKEVEESGPNVNKDYVPATVDEYIEWREQNNYKSLRKEEEAELRKLEKQDSYINWLSDYAESIKTSADYEREMDKSKEDRFKVETAPERTGLYQKYSELAQKRKGALMNEMPDEVYKNVFTNLQEENEDSAKRILMDSGYSEDDAEYLISAVQIDVDKLEAYEKQLEDEEFIHEGTGNRLVGGLGSILLNAGGAIVGGLDTAGQYFRNLTIDEKYRPEINAYTDAQRWSLQAQNYRSAVNDELEIEGWKFQPLQMLYNAANSTADNALAMSAGKLTGIKNMVGITNAASTLSNTVRNYKDKGFSDEEAMAGGLFEALISGATEQFSIDKIVSMDSPTTIKGIFLNALKSGGIEGAEEIADSTATKIYETITQGDKSEYMELYNSYINEGMSEAEATTQTILDMAGDTLVDGMTGFLSGTMMGGTTSTQNYLYANSKQGKAGKNVVKNNLYGELKNYIANTYGTDSKIYAQMQNTNEKSNIEVGQLVSSAILEEQKQAETEYKKAIEEPITGRLVDMGVTYEAAVRIAQSVTKGMPDNETQYASQKRQVLGEVEQALNGNINESNAWFADVDMSAYDRHNNALNKLINMAEGKSFNEEVENINENDIKVKIEEKTARGEITNGTAHLISNPDIEFDIVTQVVGKDGKTKAVVSGSKELYDMEDVAADESSIAIYELGEQYTADERGNFFKAWDVAGEFANPTEFAVAYQSVFNAGAEGLGIANARKSASMTLTDRQIHLAYEAGQINRAKNVIAKKKAALVKRRGEGSIKFDGVNRESLNETQKAAVDVAEVMAKATGVNITIYASEKSAEGKYIGENGSYSHIDNSIRIDINAGKITEEQGHNIMILTLAHELTHHIEQTSPEGWEKLQEFVFEKLAREEGKSIEQIIDEEMRSKNLSREVAKSELVARGCELVLTNEKAIQELAKRDRGLFGLIKNKIISFCKNVEKACQELLKDGDIKANTASQEALLLKNYAHELSVLWNEALKEAGEKSKYNETNNNSSLNMIRYDVNNVPFVEIEEDILYGVSEDKWNDTVKSVLKSKFKKGVKVGRNTIWQNRDGRKEFLFSKYSQKIYNTDKTLYMDKLRVSNNADEVVMASRDYVNQELKHNRKDGLKEFAWGTVNLRIGSNDYSADVIIGNNGTRLYLYDIVNLDKIIIKERRSNQQRYSPNGKVLNIVASSKNSITENQETSNTQTLNQSRDSSGRVLTEAQQEHHKESKVRDKNGNLLVMYHGTPQGGFTVFKNDLTFFTSNKEYADIYQSASASSRNSRKTESSPGTYEVYLNIKKPFDIRDKKTRDIFINEYVKGGWALGINPYEEYKDTTSTGLPSWEEADNIYEFLEENDMLDDYDGIVVDEGGIPGENGEVISRGIAYVTFNSNQIKNVTNENPTDDPDIMYQSRNQSYDKLVKEYERLEKEVDEVQNRLSAYKETEKFTAYLEETDNAKKGKRFSEYVQQLRTIKDKYKEIIEKYDELKEEYNNKYTEMVEVRKEIARLDELAKERDRNHFYEQVHNDVDSYVNKAEERFGTTKNYRLAAYITTKGSMLDFSDGQDERTLDHREISEVLEAPENAGYSDGLIAFVNAGNIRMNAYGVEMAKNPTEKQLSTLRGFFNSLRGEVTVDFAKDNGDIEHSVEYSKGTSSARILSDIKRYYEDGTVPKNTYNQLSEFLYQSRYTPKTYEEALKQNAKYQEVIENLKAQMKVTKGHKVGRDGIIRLTNKLVRDTKTIKDKMEIRNQLNEVFDKAAKSKWDAEQTIEALKPIVLEALNERSANRKRLPYATEILGDLRRRRIKLDDTQKSEIEYSSGMKYNDWRKSMMGKIIIAEDGRSLDSVWSELSAIYPDTFNEEISSADQPGELDYIIYTLQNTYEEDYGFNLNDAAEFYATELVAEYARLPEVMTYADKQQAKLIKMQEDYQVAVGAIKKEYENKQKELEKEYKTNISEARALWKAEQLNREWKLKEFYKEKIKQREESIRNREDSVWSTRSKEKVRNHIIKTVKSISTQLVNPTNARHIPEEFRQATVEFCRLFTENTSVFDYKRLNELAIAYGNIEATTDLTVDEDMKDMIDGLRKLVEGKRLSQLNRVELEMVKDIVDHFNHLIKTVNQMFVEGKQVELFDWGNKALDELQAQGEKVQIRSDYEGINSLLDGKDQFFENNKTPVYFFKGLGETFNSLFADIRGGQDRFGRNIANAKKYIDDVQEKYHYNKWSMSDKIKLTEDIQLDREQAMFLYATYKRERNNTAQEARHVEEGGIIIDSVEVEKKKLVRKTKRQKQGYKVTVSDMNKISDFLTAEQKAYVDAMVAYLSKDMAELGNETSMKLHGITKYHEKYYFPYDVAKSELKTTTKGNEKLPGIARPGFSKSVTKGANNAISIGSFSETCATHINQMCLYNGLAVAQENLNRVYNFKDIRWDDAEGQNVGTGLTVKQVLENAKGEQAAKYMTNFITSLNNGIQSDPMNTVSHMFVSKFKKGATFASASVTIQQISSVVRAMAVIDPKYFTKVKFNSKLWEECKKYNGVAVIKEIGGFDTGIGRGTVEYLSGKRAKTLPGKMYNKVDELGGKAPAYMDKVAWCNIWSAVKAETKEKYKFRGDEEEFFKKASERFDEVINLTQVYDSVISKSLNMQSKDGLMQMITSFMTEPTLTYNLLLDSVNSKNKKYMARAISAVTVQIAVNSALKALVQAARNGKDEDEDKSYLEKWAKSFSDNFVGDIWPHNMIPILRDISSMFQGYDVERTDMTIISELVDSMTMVYDFVSGDSNKTTLEVITDLGTSMSAAVGLPAGNVIKDIKGAFNLVNDSLEGNILPENSEDIIMAFREGLGYKYSINDEAKEYISTGDKEVLEDMIQYQVEQLKDKYPSYSDEKILEKAKSNVRSSLTKRLKEDYITGTKEERNEILQIMQESGVYTTTKDGVEVEASKETAISWEVNALKAEYIATTSAKDRNEIRKKLYATGKWDSLTKLDEQLKKWIE